MVFLPSLRFNLYTKLGYKVTNVVLHRYWWFEDGEPDWMNTVVHLQKGTKFRRIKFNDNVQDAIKTYVKQKGLVS